MTANIPPDVSVATSVFTAITAAGRCLDEPKLYELSAQIVHEYLSRAVAAIAPQVPEPVTPVVTRR